MDPDGAAWVRANANPQRPGVYPPDLLILDAQATILARLDYRSSHTDILDALSTAAGQPRPPRSAAWQGLARIEARLQRGDAEPAQAQAALQAWAAEHGGAGLDEQVAGQILHGAALYRAGQWAAARACWQAVVDEHPAHPLRHRARYHLYDAHSWPTRLHPDLQGAMLPPAAAAVAPDPARLARNQQRLRAPPYVSGGGLLPMCRIPAGAFRMGDDQGLLPRERPAHRVEIPQDFWLSATPVTRRQWRCFAEGPWPPGGDEMPATGISFGQAVAFCAWLSAREGRGYALPTEARWEYAARGGLDGAPHPWGDAPVSAERCSYLGPRPCPVAAYAPNGYGLFDMVGNTQEWTADWFQERAYDRGPCVDPAGPSCSDDGLPLRVVRGGLCGAPVCALMCRNSFRIGLFEGFTGGSISFRVMASEPS